MKIKIIIFISLIFFSIRGNAQNMVSSEERIKTLNQYPAELIKTDEEGNRYYYDEKKRAKIYEINGEVLVVMDDLYLVTKPQFNNQLDRNYYFFLNKKLNRVYPLFLCAIDQYRKLKTTINSLKSTEKRQFIKHKQEELTLQYESKLRDLTTSEGRIFAKLMYRATGKTVYEIIKELRGGWSAFWWNVKGNIVDVSIKMEYNPHRYREDLFVETLLQSSWNLGLLEPYKGCKDFKAER